MSLYKLGRTVFYSYINPVDTAKVIVSVKGNAYSDKYSKYLYELHAINDFDFFRKIPRNFLVQKFYLSTVTLGFNYEQSYKSRNRIFQDNKSFLQDKVEEKLTYDFKEVANRTALEVTDMNEKKYKAELRRIAKEVEGYVGTRTYEPLHRCW